MPMVGGYVCHSILFSLFNVVYDLSALSIGEEEGGGLPGSGDLEGPRSDSLDGGDSEEAKSTFIVR